MNNLYDFIIKHKELIKKVLPITLLRKCKMAVINRKIEQYQPKSINSVQYGCHPFGVNLIGDIRIEIGLGQSMRLISNALDLSKQDFCILNLPLNVDVRRNDHSWDHKISHEPVFGINILHINPQEIGLSYLSLGKTTFRNRYNIGYWLWELEKAPEETALALKFVDEIWTPSEFTSNCFRKITDKPVFTIPYYVTAEAKSRYDRAHFQLPENVFLYLIMFDFNSTMLRKNPQAAIEAFRNAFPPEQQDVGLVIKVNNPTPACMEALKNSLDEYQNVYYITNTLDRDEVNSLISAVDVFVSLHRAEGFGLVMAEAMLLKTACIATNWSSNTEFMNDDAACMVSCSMEQIEEGEGNYPPGATWADPSVDETTMYMKKLKEDPAYYHSMVECAYSYVSEILGKERIIALLKNRLSTIDDALLLGELDKLIIHSNTEEYTHT